MKPNRWPLSRAHRADPDTWLDFAISLGGEAADTLIADLADDLTKAEGRKRRRRRADEVRFNRTLRMVVANAFWADFYRFSSIVCHYRKRDAYPSADQPAWLSSKCLVRVIDALAEQNYLSVEKGSWGLFPGLGESSMFWIKPALMEKLAKHHVLLSNVRLDPSCVVPIRMKDQFGKIAVISPGDRIAAKLRSNLSAINACLNQAEIDLDCAPKNLEALCKEMRETPVAEQHYRPRRPEFFRTVLFRVFNNNRWDHGGRLYGGWWQSIPSSWRSKIKINGEPTVELDFSGFSVRAIYHSKGIDYRDDPYILYKFGKGQSANDYRPHVKAITQALINGEEGSKPEMIRLPSERKLPKGLKRSNLREWILDQHSPISSSFCSGIGLQLQRLDSDIAEAILLRGAAENVVILPIHDSFVVQRRHEDWLRSTMVDCYRSKTGFDPLISQSH